jgi:hypothetical protein
LIVIGALVAVTQTFNVTDLHLLHLELVLLLEPHWIATTIFAQTLT